MKGSAKLPAAIMLIIIGFIFLMIGYAAAQSTTGTFPDNNDNSTDDEWPWNPGGGDSGDGGSDSAHGGGGSNQPLFTLSPIAFGLNLFELLGIALIVIGIIVTL